MDARARRENEHQRRIRDQVLVPQLYASLFDSYVLLDRGNVSVALQRAGVDTIGVVHGTNDVVGVDEKITRCKRFMHYDALALETERKLSEGGAWVDAWLRYSIADWLLYCWCQIDCLQVMLLSMPGCRRFVAMDEERWPLSERDDAEHGRTRCRIVKLAALREAGLLLDQWTLRPTAEVDHDLFPEAWAA